MTLAGMLVQTGIRRRAQHPKQHGCVRATFEVLDDIPADYKVGLFARPASYDAIIRFSNGRQAEDRGPGAQGMSIKLIGVPGRKILEAQADAGTHDFILVDGPVFFVRDTESYARLVNEVFTNVLKGLPPEAPPEKWLASVKKAHPEDIPVVENYTNRVVDSPLARQFWSQVPYAFGQGDGTICRYSAVPHPENMIAPIPPAFRDADYLRRAMVDHLKTAARPAVFDFCAQLRTDATPEVIDNPTVEWDTPFQRVAVIAIPAQDFDRPEQDRFGENLSYTPWHALPEHRPVGQINEIRRSVYAASSRARHLANLVDEQEPTSVYPPKSYSTRLKSIAKIAAAVAVVSGTAIGAGIAWPKLHVALPEYPKVEKQVWLEQNWAPSAREWFHHANQGGQFPPMVSIPYEWFIALEQPTLSLGAADLLADQHYLDRFGFIASISESGAYDWRTCREPQAVTGYESGTASSPTWRHRLPVGFACSDPERDPMLHPDGKPWRNPATGKTMSAVGVTCAACHTGRFIHGTTEVLIDGGSALTDIIKLNEAIGMSLVFTRYVPFRFDRFALRLLGSDSNNATRAALIEQLDDVVKRFMAFNKLDKKAARHGVEEGYGRLDAVNRIGNQVFSTDLGNPDNYVGASAPVHYPRIWSVPWFAWAQYNGSIGQPMVRNAGEALGTGAPVVLQGAPSSGTPLTAPLFTSVAQFRTLFEMEQLLAGKQPNATDGFKGLVAPKWPAEILGPIDPELAERGARLYDDKCAHCHLAPVGSTVFWNSENWLPPNKFGQRYLNVNLIPVEEVGTDARAADGFATRKVNLPPELGITTDGFAVALSQLVEKTVTRWYDGQTPPLPEEKRHEMDGYRSNDAQSKIAYKARPLDGVWATPPYLHNGSVPTIEALLSPVAERPQKFWLGNRIYDPVHLGYQSDKVTGGFELDTTKPGNHNTGHEFDDGPTRPGRIGRKLSPDDRRALIEFLKTL
jgi:hypothetical protein